MMDINTCSGQPPLVSVILITYNQVEYIEQALQSVLAQRTTFPLEILIGDDASTDGTSEIVRRYCTQYPSLIRAFIRPQNVGASKNAYSLLQHARGKYLASLEGDDYWTDPEKLQKQADVLEQHPEWIGCAHRIACVDRLGNPRPGGPHWIKHKGVFTLRDFKGIYLPGQASSLMRRNIFQKPQHDYSILFKADAMVSDRTAMLIFLLQGDFCCIPQVMSAYRYVTKESGRNITSQIFQNDLRVWEDYNLTCELERYAHKEFGVSVTFNRLKRELYAKALCKHLLRKSEQTKDIVHRIAQDPVVGWRGKVAFPVSCLKFLIRHVRRES